MAGLATILVEAGVISAGKAEALHTASQIKRTRYAHQVTVSALHLLQQSAFEATVSAESDHQSEQLSLDSWCQLMCDKHPHFFYWNTVIEIQLLINQFVRAQREGNFLLYIDVLDKFMSWFFALDHVHYSRWLLVHIRDLVCLKERHPALFDEFRKGNFVVQRSSHRFSLLPLDQSHEQSNKYVKGDGGAVGLFDDPAAL